MIVFIYISIDVLIQSTMNNVSYNVLESSVKNTSAIFQTHFDGSFECVIEIESAGVFTFVQYFLLNV